MEIFLSCPGDLLAIALSLFSPEKGGQEKPPVNVRGVGESHEIVKQTDFGLGVDARESLGSPLSPEALRNSSLPHDLVIGGISLGGSRQKSSCISTPYINVRLDQPKNPGRKRGARLCFLPLQGPSPHVSAACYFYLSGVCSPDTLS